MKHLVTDYIEVHGKRTVGWGHEEPGRKPFVV